MVKVEQPRAERDGSMRNSGIYNWRALPVYDGQTDSSTRYAIAGKRAPQEGTVYRKLYGARS